MTDNSRSDFPRERPTDGASQNQKKEMMLLDRVSSDGASESTTKNSHAQKQKQQAVQNARSTQIQSARQALENLVAAFADPHTLEDAVVKTFLDPLDVPQQKYSAANRILLAVQGATDARGTAAWRKAGRAPADGSCQVFIMMPKTRRVRDESTGETKTITTGFFFRGLYDVNSTVGEEVKYVKNPPRELPPLSDVAKKWGVRVTYRVESGAWGTFDPANNEISLGTDDAGTFFHELAHKAHEKVDGRLRPGQDPEQETIAQLCAGVLCRMYGKKADLYTYRYIRAYAQDDPDQALKLIGRVLSKAGKVLELILNTAGHRKEGGDSASSSSATQKTGSRP